MVKTWGCLSKRIPGISGILHFALEPGWSVSKKCTFFYWRSNGEARTVSSIISLDPYNNPLETYGGYLVWNFSGQLIKIHPAFESWIICKIYTIVRDSNFRLSLGLDLISWIQMPFLIYPPTLAAARLWDLHLERVGLVANCLIPGECREPGRGRSPRGHVAGLPFPSRGIWRTGCLSLTTSHVRWIIPSPVRRNQWKYRGQQFLTRYIWEVFYWLKNHRETEHICFQGTPWACSFSPLPPPDLTGGEFESQRS